LNEALKQIKDLPVLEQLKLIESFSAYLRQIHSKEKPFITQPVEPEFMDFLNSKYAALHGIPS
jgi:hypothetical protein